MEELLRRLVSLEKDNASMVVYWSIAKYVAGTLLVYIVGFGYYFWRWTRKFEKEHNERVDKRSDDLFEHFGGEKMDLGEKISLLDQCSKEQAGVMNLLFEKIKHEAEQRKQQISDCKERCEAVRCNDK